ncbi:hypothetical protein CPT_Morttis_231 [Acinetobacter phage Morttis]|nr:hypothetical protein CPT_Maestro_237 [Acinetobacter phage Maestro]QQM18717.1 hypothetical protein CPT_Morttis_231 [Acinetobacter phage Morttis]
MIGIVILLIVLLGALFRRNRQQAKMISKLKYDVFCGNLKFYRVKNELNRIKNPLPDLSSLKKLEFIGFDKIALNFFNR